jgi:hypothetical protein
MMDRGPAGQGLEFKQLFPVLLVVFGDWENRDVYSGVPSQQIGDSSEV